jgi:uncharacterized protein HemY
MLDAQRLDEAETYLLRSAALFPDGPDIQYQLGLLRYRQQRDRAAEKHLRRADGSDARAHRLLVTVLERQGRAREAKAHRREAERLDPERVRPPSN